MTAQAAHPESIVDTDWVAEHGGDDSVVLVEVDVDTEAYEQGHIPGAVGWNWTTQLNDTVTRDILNKEQIECLLGSSGITPDTTIILYGDNNNWFATYAFWQLKIYGHADVRVMDGGRIKWVSEGRDLTTDAPCVEATSYTASDADLSTRATREDMLSIASGEDHVGHGRRAGAGGVQRRASGPGEPAARGFAARRPHTRSDQHPLADRRQRGRRDVQVGRGPSGGVPGQGDHRGRPDRRLLPHRRARSSHTWFVLEPNTRLRRRQELRRPHGPSMGASWARRSRSDANFVVMGRCS